MSGDEEGVSEDKKNKYDESEECGSLSIENGLECPKGKDPSKAKKTLNHLLQVQLWRTLCQIRSEDKLRLMQSSFQSV